VRRRAQQHAIDDAEHGRVPAEPQGESDGDHADKSRIAPEGAKAATEVLPPPAPEVAALTPLFAASVQRPQRLAHLLDIAEPALCLASGVLG
jgi:hypothetical protein